MTHSYIPDLAYERRGTGVPLVLLHGYPLDHTIWAPLAPLLEERFDLILPDLRGFGRSEAVSDPYGMVDMAADVAGLLGRLGLAQAFVAGHSMGGYVALAMAAHFPGSLLGLGLIASQLAADPPERQALRHATAEQVAREGVGVVAGSMPVKLAGDPAVQAQAARTIARQQPAALIGALRAMAARPDSGAVLAAFRLPVLLVHGTHDELIPFERAKEARERAPHALLVELPGVGHMPMLEAPEATAAALKRAFLVE